MTEKQKCLSQWLGLDSVMLQVGGKLEDLRIQTNSSWKIFQALGIAVRMGSKSSTFQNRQEKIPGPFVSQADDKIN